MTTKTNLEPDAGYVSLACDTSDHLIRFLGGQKAPEQIADACRFFHPQHNPQTDETCWVQNDKKLLTEEKNRSTSSDSHPLQYLPAEL